MASKTSSSSSSSPSLDGRALFYMALLAVQFGIQPILTRTYAAPSINKSTVVLMQEVVKFGLAFMMLHVSGARATALKGMYVCMYFATRRSIVTTGLLRRCEQKFLARVASL